MSTKASSQLIDDIRLAEPVRSLAEPETLEPLEHLRFRNGSNGAKRLNALNDLSVSPILIQPSFSLPPEAGRVLWSFGRPSFRSRLRPAQEADPSFPGRATGRTGVRPCISQQKRSRRMLRAGTQALPDLPVIGEIRRTRPRAQRS